MAKILVVDDDDMIQQLVLACLSDRGHEVILADNGRRGLELARTHIPDLIISDVTMPEMSGQELLTTLRSDPATDIIPFIFMTGQVTTTTVRMGMGMGADDFLAKPFPMEEMVSAVEARLKKQAIVRQFAERRLADLRASLSSSLPHELLTPLTRILLCADQLKNDYQDVQHGEIQQLATVIHDSANSLHRLIENYLIHARIEKLSDPQQMAGLMQIGQSTLIGPPIATASKIVAARFHRESDISIKLIDAKVAVAEEHFRKIVSELLENAFKFSSAGSPVTLTASLGPETLRLTITDRGCGMTPQQVANIAACKQFDRDLKEQQGVGLGLTIAKRLIELHGGVFNFDSHLDAGTTVLVELPEAH